MSGITLLLILVAFVFFAGLAMTINEGLWSNTVLLMFILIGGTAGVLGGVPLGNLLLEQSGKGDSFAWYFVFAGIWGVFAISVLLLRIVAEKASLTRVRFLPVVDKLGGIVMGLVVAVMFSSFVAYTLLKVPIQAGEWPYNKASASVQSNFQRAATPFNSALSAFVKAEGINSQL